MQLSIKNCTQWLIHGLADDIVPANFSRNYAQEKKQKCEDVHLLEISTAGHFDLIDGKRVEVDGSLRPFIGPSCSCRVPH